MSSAGPNDPAAHPVITRLVEACATDERVVAAFLGGSRARDEADEHSDIDVSVIVVDDAYDEVIVGRDRFVRRIGDPVFLEDFGNENMAFVILGDGTELELHFFRASDLRSIRSGPHRVLLDEHGILAGMEFPPPDLDRDTQTKELRQLLFWFWHDVGHFTTAMGREQLWWGAGQLRHYCVKLARIEQDVIVEDEPYWKLDVEISTEPLDALRSTFVPFERDAMLKAALDLVAYFRERAPVVARLSGLTYPTDLDRLVSGHLDHRDARQG